ncbi:hypothetical protein QF043_001216 [Pseudomonas sp. W3I7]|uniref:hypothetical protein n=1 Tax=Pseudomonas sp. W3I7 TaxID=3042292 RepID=UPI00278D45F9|nr:hypothetical protein [Pseudomonas sp. W3I7]MDQ0702424.1 hypothetical protein [Pseudomonas sp. W3I7]
MERSTQFPELLFSYGTLQDKAVQLANFGRELVGQHELGYAQSWVEAAADAYEVSDYKRVSVALASGLTAWVYVQAQ